MDRQTDREREEGDENRNRGVQNETFREREGFREWE